MNRLFDKKFILPVFALVIVIDQIIKFFIIEKVPTEGIFLLKSKILEFSIANQINEGIAFGIGLPRTAIYFFVTLIILALVMICVKEIKDGRRRTGFILSILIAGAVSNLIDRLLYGGVVDYLSLSFFKFSWPTFNLADVMIVGGAVGVLGMVIFKSKVHLRLVPRSGSEKGPK